MLGERVLLIRSACRKQDRFCWAVEAVRIDQGYLAIGHLARAALDLGGPKGIGIGIGVFGVQAGDEVMG